VPGLPASPVVAPLERDVTRLPSNACVYCGQARLVAGFWVVSATTPPECDHETIDGER
jgi:hypothetical protein